MYELGAELHRHGQAGLSEGPAAAADTIARLEHKHRASGASQHVRRGEPRRAGADDDYVVLGK